MIPFSPHPPQPLNVLCMCSCLMADHCGGGGKILCASTRHANAPESDDVCLISVLFQLRVSLISQPMLPVAVARDIERRIIDALGLEPALDPGNEFNRGPPTASHHRRGSRDAKRGSHSTSNSRSFRSNSENDGGMLTSSAFELSPAAQRAIRRLSSIDCSGMRGRPWSRPSVQGVEWFSYCQRVSLQSAGGSRCAFGPSAAQSISFYRDSGV